MALGQARGVRGGYPQPGRPFLARRWPWWELRLFHGHLVPQTRAECHRAPGEQPDCRPAPWGPCPTQAPAELAGTGAAVQAPGEEGSGGAQRQAGSAPSSRSACAPANWPARNAAGRVQSGALASSLQTRFSGSPPCRRPQYTSSLQPQSYASPEPRFPCLPSPRIPCPGH